MNFLQRALLTSLVPALLVSSLAGDASAQTAAVTAQIEFDEAKKLMAKGDYAAACPKLATSQRLDPSGGTILNLADCSERIGKLATAYLHYNEGLRMALRDKRNDRETFARERIANLTGRIGKLKLVLPAQAARLDAYTVQLDGTKIESAVLESVIPVDAGSHNLRVEATGYEPATLTIEAKDGQVVEATLPELEHSSSATPAPSVVVTPPTETSSTASTGSGQRTLGWVATGVGAAGLVAGGVFGLMAMGKRANIDNEPGCQDDDGTLRCSDPGARDRLNADQSTARSLATVSTIGFIAGGALLAGGLVLVLTAPKSQHSATLGVSPTLGGASVGLSGRF